MSSSKKIYLKRAFAAGVYLSVLYFPPRYTQYTYIIHVLIHTGKGGGELNDREGERDNRSQSWVENTNMTDARNWLSPVYRV
jgi:hypothetical protein